ncbi:MAG: ABC transporter permease [Actinomycetes bacterium]
MSTSTATPQVGPRTGHPDPTTGPGQVFLAVLWRDVFVTGKELVVFFAQVILQPLFLLFVFGKVLTELGYAQHDFARLLFPGIVALTAMITAIQSTALPLVIDFSFSKEIEDRLLAPMPTWAVAVEKIIFSATRSLIAAAVMFPVGVWILGSIPFPAAGIPLMVAVLILGALVGAAIGLTLGTVVPPSRINIIFALILTPLLFTGASQYPWLSLHRILWFQVVTAFNPLTYVSEGMRAALVPDVPHIHPWISLLVLVGSLALFTWTGICGFLRRAID